MKILLFGATGMLGKALSSEAKKRKYSVIGAARNNADICVDLSDDYAVARIITSTRPDIIINAAAMINLKECEINSEQAYRINARSVGILANLAKINMAYFVQVSTDHYFTGDRDKKHKEDSEVILLNEYARTKYAGEAYALTYKNSMVVRTNIVGFRGQVNSPTFIEWVLHSLEKKLPFTMFEDFYTSSIDVYTFSKVLMDLIAINYTGIINVGSSEVISKKEFIMMVAQKAGYNIDRAQIGSVINIADGIPRAESLGLDVSLAESILKYTLPHSSEVIDRLVMEYKKGAVIS